MNSRNYISIWTERYVQYKNALIRGIVENKNGRIELKTKDKTTSYIPTESLGDSPENCTIITYNTKQNFERLIKNWDMLVEKKATVIFINPLSKLDDKWIVAPHIHQKISEKASLKRGLKTMSESVEEITEEQIKKLSDGD